MRTIASILFAAIALVWQASQEEFFKPEADKIPEWMENLVQLEHMSIENVTKEQEDVLIRSKIPPSMWPYVNITAVVERERKRNATDGGVITDEDVADIPDDDEHPLPNTMHNDGKKTTITITDDAALKLYQHWTDQAVSGLMATVATEKLKKVGQTEKLIHKECNKKAKTVKEHAKCVVTLLDAEEKYQRWVRNHEEKERRVGKISSLKRRNRVNLDDEEPAFRVEGRNSRRSHQPRREQSEQYVQEHYPTEDNWVGSFKMRAKRSAKAQKPPKPPKMMQVKPVTRDRYDLIDEAKESPLGMIAKNLLRDIRRYKNKPDKDFKQWKAVVSEIREEGKKIRQKEKQQDMIKRRLRMFTKAANEDEANKDMLKKMSVFDDEAQLDEVMMKIRKEQSKASLHEKLLSAPMELVRGAVKLSMMMNGKNVSDFEKKNLKMVSPRFFPVVPEEDDDEIKILSPSLFALHNEGKGIEKETSLGKAMSIFGKKDNDAWLDFILETSGVNDALDSMKDGTYSMNRSRKRDDPFYSPDGQPLWFTKENVTEMFGDTEKEKIEIFERLHKSFQRDQIAQMNKTGYFVMNDKQIEMMYGPTSPMYDPETYKSLSNVSAADVPAMLDKTIRGLAAETMEFKVQRRKQIVLSPLVLSPVILDPATASQPIILSPLLLDPLVLSPSVFGVVVLSPWVFVPIILAPRVLAPVILSPSVFSPLVLSPLALDPLVLSPSVGTPFVLSPLVLSPFVLSPVAMNPLILSPFCLTPLIGIPHTMTPLILSPFVLSPVLYSPPYYSFFFMSPYALSPIIESQGQHFISMLSPSWLS